MKFYIDLSTRRFVRGPASGIPLDRTFFKRRDKVDIEIVFVEKSAIVPTPAGTTFATGLKRSPMPVAYSISTPLPSRSFSPMIPPPSPRCWR
jgi:hypothetical protein